MQIELFILSVTIYQVLSQCAPRIIRLHGLDGKPKRSKPLLGQVTVINCHGFHEVYYDWEVKEIATSKVVQNVSGPSILIDGYTYNSDGIFQKDYLLTVFVSHYPDMRWYSSQSKAFRFSPDEMFIAIKGGTEKTHAANTPLEVDAESESTDISYLPSEDAFKGDLVEWTIEPKIPGFTPSNNLKLRVPESVLQVGQVYKFTVKVTRKVADHVDIQMAHQFVTVKSTEISELNLECIRNCFNPNPKEKTALRVVCSKNCHNLKYKWSISPSIDRDKTDMGDGFDKILIKPGAFKMGDKITIMASSGSATSSYYLAFTEKIKNGTCDITPKEGVSGITVFKIECKDFSSGNDKLTYLISQKIGKSNKSVILHRGTSVEESDVVLSEGSPAEILVTVLGDGYAEAKVELNVQVKPFPFSGKISDLVKILVLLDEKSLSLEQKRNKVVQTVSCLLDVIDSNNITDAAKADLHSQMAEKLLNDSPQDFVAASQTVSTLMKLESFKLDTDTLTSRLIGKTMQRVTKAVPDSINTHSKNEVPYIPEMLLIEFAEDIFHLSSRLVRKVPALEAVLEEEMEVHDYDSYDEMSSAKLSTRDNLRDVTDSVLTSIQVVVPTVLRNSYPEERPITFNNDLLKFTAKRTLLKSLSLNHTITYPDGSKSKVSVPKPLIEELNEKYSIIDYQFALAHISPFWWHQNNKRLNTEILLFDFFNHSSKISATRNPFHVYLKTNNIPTGILKGNVTNSGIAAHRIHLESTAMLVVVFEASGESYMVTTSNCYCKKEDFVRGVEIRSDSDEGERTLTVRGSDDKNVVYVCVMKPGAWLQYKGNFAIFSCTYWDLKIGEWNSDGCTVQKASLQNSGFLVCECTHASLFAGQVYVSVNKMNVNESVEFHIEILRHWGLLLFLSGLIVVWCMFLLGAWWIDRKHIKKNTVYKLDDNVPGDSHAYLVVVVTGFFWDSGTTADVAFQIIGDEASSRIHLIKATGAEFLLQNAQDWLIIFAPNYLGRVRKIRLWHNCKGVSPHWYCQKILVQHLESGVQYFFLVEKWFSLIWGQGRIKYEIKTRSNASCMSKKLLFILNFETEIRDGHPWISVFMRDSQSNFTSLERVGTSVCVFFFTMLASAFFHNMPHTGPTNSVDPYSLDFFTSRNIIAVVQSSLVSIPIGMIVIYLFRNSNPNFPPRKRKRIKK